MGAANVGVGVLKVSSGATLATTGAVTGPIPGLISGPASAIGTHHPASGVAAVNRGAQQLSQSLDDPGGAEFGKSPRLGADGPEVR